MNGLGCSACNLTGCLDCSNLTHCATCDEQRNYYLEGGVCTLIASAFSLIQSLETTSFRTRSIAITDDNSVIAMGFKISKTRFFTQNGSSFFLDYTYTSSVSSGDTISGEFTSDKEWYITVQLQQGISILKRNSGTGVYEEYQQITLVTSG